MKITFANGNSMLIPDEPVDDPVRGFDSRRDPYDKSTEADTAETQEYGKIHATLVNTPLKVSQLLKKLNGYTGWLGFDTEVSGPQLRGRDFVNISHSVLLGLSLAFNDGKCFYVPVRHRGNNVSFKELKAIHEAIKCKPLWAHNAKFDHQPMIQAGLPLLFLYDSMIAAWLVTGENWGLGLKAQASLVLNRKSPPFDPAIASKTGEEAKLYACHDALNTLELGLHYWERLDLKQQQWLMQECRFTRTLAEMKLQGFALDYGKLRGIEHQAQKEQQGLQQEWNKLAGGISITSAKQLQGLFEDGTWKPKGLTKGGAFSTAGTCMEYNVKQAQTPAGKQLAQLRLDYQEVAKIVSTYSEGLLEEAAQWADGKLHPDLFHFGTVTGRLASANPNIQNMPAHGDWAKRVRECFVPDEGMVFTSADYSQVELRYFADYCGGALLDVLMKGEDPHAKTAKAMGCTRDQGKTINFGFLLYGGAPAKLANDVLKCSEAEAKERIEALHAEYPSVEPWRQNVIDVVTARGPMPWARTLAGRIRYFPELDPEQLKATRPEDYAALTKKYNGNCKMRGKQPTDKGLWYSIRSSGQRRLVNYLIQGGSRDLLVIGMNSYNAHPDKTDDMKIITTVHDEVLTQHHPINTDLATKVLKESLEGAGEVLGLKVPIIAEPKTGYTWAEVK